MERIIVGWDDDGKVVMVVIVVIQPVLELTPVQVIQARPTGSRVSVTVCNKRKKEKKEVMTLPPLSPP